MIDKHVVVKTFGDFLNKKEYYYSKYKNIHKFKWMMKN